MAKNTEEVKTIFITGTDTGVGKTLLTGLLLHHLRTEGCHALAMKPFCSGGRGDVEFLHALQDGELSEREINPFYFHEPVAPLLAARKNARAIHLKDVVTRIQAIVSQLGARGGAKCLLIEGAGGLLVPLGEKKASHRGVTGGGVLAGNKIYTLGDVINELDCRVIVVAPNRLGTINHTLLTVRELQHIGIKNVTIVIMGAEKPENSTKTNPKLLMELVAPMNVFSVRFFQKEPFEIATLKKNAKNIKKTLALIVA